MMVPHPPAEGGQDLAASLTQTDAPVAVRDAVAAQDHLERAASEAAATLPTTLAIILEPGRTDKYRLNPPRLLFRTVCDRPRRSPGR